MGKKNKKGSGNNPQDSGQGASGSQQGASGGGPPGEKKKDSAQGPADHQKKQQQQKKEKGQQQQSQGSQQQPQPQQSQGQRQQQPQGQPQQQQPQEHRGQQGQRKQQPQQSQQQAQGSWGQQGQRQQQQQPQQQQPQGSQQKLQPQQSQGPRQQQQPQQQQPQEHRGQQGQRQQQPQQAQQQQPQQQQQAQGAWSQQGQRQQQPQQAQQQAQGAWGQQGQRQQQPQQSQQQQAQGAWSQQGQRQQPQQQQTQGAWSQQGQRKQQTEQWSQGPPRQQQQQGSRQAQPSQGGRPQWQERPPSEGGYGRQQQRGPRQDQGGQYQQRQPEQQQQAIVPIAAAHPNSPARGTRGQAFSLETNYLTLDLNKMPDVAYHYDVKIDPDRPKKFVRKAFDAFVKKFCRNFPLAYDGKANAYSVDMLPEDVLKVTQDAEVQIDEEDRKFTFKISLKATEDIKVDLKSLKMYQNDRIFEKPMRALQCIEVVLSLPCHEKAVRAGRSYFMKPPGRPCDLGDGFELWFGLYQAAMLCDMPLLNVDVSHKSFPSEVNLVEFYDEPRRGGPRGLGDFLKGLRVDYTPPVCFKSKTRGYKFLKIMDACSKQLFKTDDGKQQTVAEYFRSKGYTLQRPDLPCLHVGSSVKNIYIPLELLKVPLGQAIMRKDNENQVRQMIRYAATSTDERKEKIMRLLNFFKYNMHPTVQRFGLSVGNQFINIPARLLQSPQIQYAGGRNISIDRPGEWMMKKETFLKCSKVINKWAIINISGKREINEMFLREHFVGEVIRLAGSLKMSLDSKCFGIIEPSSASTSRSGGYRKPEVISIEEHLRKLKRESVSLVFVILPYASESYAKVKQEAELSCGIVTQCIKGDTMRSESRMRGVQTINQMTISNILLKVNAKLNGTNHRISPTNEISLQQRAKVMFVGADVSHPSPLQKNLPSIVGVVASHDEFGTQYNMQYRLQEPGKETILDMQNIFAEHLRVYKSNMNALPDNIIYYRDGVSDGQFKLIENIELSAMRAACKAVNCNAKFTCIIVVKRHHTRFFPKKSDGEGKFNNVKAGTVVDRTIIHPGEVQFFMVSHKSIQGTAKPTRYNVIVDDAKINIDELQAMTYNLCHLFPRCNRSVSYPAPAYLSHLVGLRGRAYIEGTNLNLENLKAEYSKRIVSDDVMKRNPMYFV